ncbi:CGNR zinc finger domain-containing protein [Streptomyces polygonati]|uniref:CGNR zinc finger domain-containing protein n=1 Tax=Streptomyces polygonati TaxID=1617087 RepID=A0ABV8HRA2_9ACTN
MPDSAAVRVLVPARFRQGSGRLCLDFLRTLRFRNTPEVTEELADPEALTAWVRQCGPCGEGPVAAPAPGRVAEARALREAVHALILAALGPDGPAAIPAAARARLNSAAAAPLPTPRLTPSGALGWHSDDPVTATLALIARDALDLATSPALLPRLRPCASPICGAFFLDHSRPGARRWCSMDTCGSRAKKAGVRARA